MFGIGNSKKEENFSIYDRENAPVSDEERNFSLYAPPKEPALLGIPRGLATGLTKKGPGVVGGALQFVSPEGSAISEAGKAITDYAATDTIPEEQKGFWEKGAELVGTILPLIVAGKIGRASCRERV